MPDRKAAEQAAIDLLADAIQMGKNFNGGAVLIRFAWNGKEYLPVIECLSADTEKTVMQALGRVP